ncbi:hypothetical protein A9Q99_16730 [Gammaproteobacteria bacterium 45_16_T64]|nr:hypothetical protein A9Q99_16730 [Gammaproteobacteria bacterium 45_16_T64]
MKITKPFSKHLKVVVFLLPIVWITSLSFLSSAIAGDISSFNELANTASAFAKGNLANVNQQGHYQDIELRQLGIQNRSINTQYGVSNTSQSKQVGFQNQSTVLQAGIKNSVNVFQRGRNNRVYVDQRGNDLQSTIIQNGNNMQARMYRDF